MEKPVQSDIEAILSYRDALGGDNWTTPDRRLGKGAPFSALECPLYLLELGVAPDDPLLRELAELIFSTWQEDGRFKVYPKGAIYPCHTAITARVLCHLGYARDHRIQRTFHHLLETQEEDGGWRCRKFSYGRGPETAASNPLPTLMALDAFRFDAGENNQSTAALDKAVDFLLAHWEYKKPLGPCHYGIGTLFMQVEYPFRGYNLFLYVYVLSFYPRARKDPRFQEAFQTLAAKTVDGEIVVERVVPKLAKFSFCAKGKPSALATKRYQEILENLR